MARPDLLLRNDHDRQLIAFMMATDIIASADGQSVKTYDAARKALCWIRMPIEAIRCDVPPTRWKVGTGKPRFNPVRPEHADRCDEVEFIGDGDALHKAADRLEQKLSRLRDKLARTPQHPDAVWLGDAAFAWVIFRRREVALAHIVARGATGISLTKMHAGLVRRTDGKKDWDAFDQRLTILQLRYQSQQ